MILLTKHFGSIIGGLTGLTTLTAIAPVWAQSPEWASATAKTIQVKVTHWGNILPPTGEKPKPITVSREELVQYDRAKGAYIEEIEVGNHTADFVPYFLANDGKTQYEVLTDRNEYIKTDALPAVNGMRSRVDFADVGVGVALGWKRVHPEVFVAAPDETENGKKFKVYVTESSMKMPGMDAVYLNKLWVDPVNNIPTRYSVFHKGGIGQEVYRVTFSDWKVNAPLNAAKFTWIPPTNFKELDDPTNSKP